MKRAHPDSAGLQDTPSSRKQANGSGPEEGKGEEYWRKKAEELKELLEDSEERRNELTVWSAQHTSTLTSIKKTLLQAAASQSDTTHAHDNVIQPWGSVKLMGYAQRHEVEAAYNAGRRQPGSACMVSRCCNDLNRAVADTRWTPTPTADTTNDPVLSRFNRRYGEGATALLLQKKREMDTHNPSGCFPVQVLWDESRECEAELCDVVTRLVSSLHHAHSTLSSLTSHKHKHKKTPPPPSAPSAPLPPSPRSPPSSPPRRAAVLVSPPTPLPPPPPPPSSPLGSRLLSRLSHYLTSTLRLPATVTLDYSSAAQDLCSRLCGFLPPPLPLDDAMSVLHWLRRRRVALLLCPLDWHAKTTPLHTFLRFLCREEECSGQWGVSQATSLAHHQAAFTTFLLTHNPHLPPNTRNDWATQAVLCVRVLGLPCHAPPVSPALDPLHGPLRQWLLDLHTQHSGLLSLLVQMRGVGGQQWMGQWLHYLNLQHLTTTSTRQQEEDTQLGLQL